MGLYRNRLRHETSVPGSQSWCHMTSRGSNRDPPTPGFSYYYADITTWPTCTMLMFFTMQTYQSSLLVYYGNSLVLCRHNDLAHWYYVTVLFYADITIWPTGILCFFSLFLSRHNDLANWYTLYTLFICYYADIAIWPAAWYYFFYVLVLYRHNDLAFWHTRVILLFYEDKTI